MIISFLDMFKHLLPDARAWRLTVDKSLRQFFDGLTGIGEDFKDYDDSIFGDLFPATTRELTAWEKQWGLPNTQLTEAERRTRLDEEWKASGGQSLQYIQDTLQAAGFDVYLHEWFAPGTEPDVGVKLCVTPRNPQNYLRREFTGLDVIYIVACNEPLAQCGEATALCGESIEPLGYPLVNKLFITDADFFTLCGEAKMHAGEVDAECGNFGGFTSVPRNYVVPNDPAKWPYFLYIGGETFPDITNVLPSRKDEFETLCLKLCPAQQWLGILVNYS